MLVTALWASQPGKYFFLTTKSGSGAWGEHCFSRNQFGKVRSFLQDNTDKDTYFCVHGFSKPQRLRDYAVLPHLLWADMDEVDPRTAKPKPTIAIESSPGRFVGIWQVDREIEESINKRLTYFLKADRGGWDLTQVLRVPNTTNYKYVSTPKVKLLWDDGPIYKLKDIVSMLPAEKKVDIKNLDPVKIIQKYQDQLRPETRRELLNGKPVLGKRSQVLFKIEHDLIKAGMTIDEAITVIKASPWNKFSGRQSEDTQLRRELDKVYNDYLKSPEKELVNGYRFLQTSMAEVEVKDLNWIWYPYLARGEVTIIEGDPEAGKSFVAQMVGKAIADGQKLPSVRPQKPVQGVVAYFDTENDSATVTKKRLIYNNCQNMHNFYQEEEPFTMDDQDKRNHVYEALEKLRPTLVVFDTISLYIGKADTGKASETTQALAVFKDIAKRFNCAVLIVRHLTKERKTSGSSKALYRGQGSIAFAGVARIVMTVGRDPEDDDVRVLSVTKCNLASHPRALTFTLTGLPDTLKRHDACVFRWEGFADYTSEEIIAGTSGKKSLASAEQFLKEALGNGGIKLDELTRMAETRSISHTSLHRASRKIGIVKTTQGFGEEKHTVWSIE